MVLAGISSCVHGHGQSGTFKRLMLTFHIVYLFKHIFTLFIFLSKSQQLLVDVTLEFLSKKFLVANFIQIADGINNSIKEFLFDNDKVN